ncbi:MAG: diphosphomevalonate decarboxylase [Flavobacteriales bacterium]|nr:diphosphomevalonate decarboxylase [Flavobacteriales bacterium]
MSTYTWTSPSNIALVKYWGKHGVQLPANPSISFTLDKCLSQTSLQLVDREEERVRFTFEGEERSGFVPKIETFLDRIGHLAPFLQDHTLIIDSENTFPHSSGIASSASAMSALSMCIASAWADREGQDEPDLKLASEMARLGSGSACRSVYGGFTLWGDTEHLERSSDSYAVPLEQIHPDFLTLQDTILLIDEGEKQVSSTLGHDLMNGHPYARARFDQAHTHIGDMLGLLKDGDFMALAEMIEREALSLHAMMMSSDPHFMLFKPGSVSVIQRVMEMRSQGLELTFTLDAGANVHLIYPESGAQKIMDIVREEFIGYCQNGAYICDNVGSGPQRVG